MNPAYIPTLLHRKTLDRFHTKRRIFGSESFAGTSPELKFHRGTPRKSKVFCALWYGVRALFVWMSYVPIDLGHLPHTMYSREISKGSELRNSSHFIGRAQGLPLLTQAGKAPGTSLPLAHGTDGRPDRGSTEGIHTALRGSVLIGLITHCKRKGEKS